MIVTVLFHIEVTGREASDSEVKAALQDILSGDQPPIAELVIEWLETSHNIEVDDLTIQVQR